MVGQNLAARPPAKNVTSPGLLRPGGGAGAPAGTAAYAAGAGVYDGRARQPGRDPRARRALGRPGVRPMAGVEWAASAKVVRLEAAMSLMITRATRWTAVATLILFGS